MSPEQYIESLKGKVDELSTKASKLTSSLLTTDDNCVQNLKTEIETAVKELYDGISALKGYASTISTNEGKLP